MFKLFKYTLILWDTKEGKKDREVGENELDKFFGIPILEVLSEIFDITKWTQIYIFTESQNQIFSYEKKGFKDYNKDVFRLGHNQERNDKSIPITKIGSPVNSKQRLITHYNN